MAEPVADEVRIQIVEPQPEPKPRPKPDLNPDPKPNPKPDADKKQGDGPQQPTHGLPRYVLLTKDGRSVGPNQKTEPWPDDISEYDGGIAADLGNDGVVDKINYDNTYHLKYRITARGDVARDVITEKYILGMRILMLGYEHALRALKDSKASAAASIAEFQDEFRRMAARGAASTVLALAENLPKIVDKSSVASTQDVE